jgi:hypothetical protein
LGCHPVAVHIYTQTIHRTTQITTEQQKYKLMWKSVGLARLCEFYPGICLTTEKKARKNLSQGKRNLSQVKKSLSQSTVCILPKATTHYKTLTNTHIIKPSQTHTLQNPLIHSHAHKHYYITRNLNPPLQIFQKRLTLT